MFDLTTIRAYLKGSGKDSLLGYEHDIQCIADAFEPHNARWSQDDVLARALLFFNHIQAYIDKFKEQFPTEPIDWVQMRIFRCVMRVFRSEDDPDTAADITITLSKRMRHFVTLESDDVEMTIIGHLIVEHGEAGVTKKRINHHKAHLSELLQRCPIKPADNTEMHVWLLNKYQDIDFSEVIRLTERIGKATFYTRTCKQYDAEYPFTCIQLDAHVNGKIQIRVWSRIYLLDDDLRSAFSGLNYVYTSHGRGVTLSLSLKKHTANDIIKRVMAFLLILTNSFLKQNQLNDMMVFFREIIQVIHQVADEPQELKWGQYQVADPEEHFADGTPEAEEISTAVSNRSVDSLQTLLKRNISPNSRCFGGLISHSGMNLVEQYRFWLGFTPVTEDNTLLLCSPYSLAILKHEGAYYLAYQNLLSNEISEHLIDNEKALSDLNRLFQKHFHDQRGIVDVQNPSDIQLLFRIIQPYIENTLEKIREKEAEKILQIVKLLLDYGMDPSLRSGSHPGLESGVEHVLMKTELPHYHPHDSINNRLLFELLKCCLFADAGRSHCYVSRSLRHTPVGKIILEAQAVIASAAKLPHYLTDVADVNPQQQNEIIIQKSPDKKITLRILPWSKILLDKNKAIRTGIMTLINSTFFNGQLNIDDDQFENILQTYVSQAVGECTFADILLNNDSEVIGFSISDIRLSTQPQEPILHFVHLAACRPEISTEYPKLMSLISFQRTFFLRHMFPSTEVITAYLASSGYSYLQLNGLQFFPKYDCLDKTTIDRLHQQFFTERPQQHDDQGVFYETVFFKPVKPRERNIKTPSDIGLEIYRTNIEKEGQSTLVAFQATKHNMRILTTKLTGNPAHFFKVAAPFKHANMGLLRFNSRL